MHKVDKVENISIDLLTELTPSVSDCIEEMIILLMFFVLCSLLAYAAFKTRWIYTKLYKVRTKFSHLGLDRRETLNFEIGR